MSNQKSSGTRIANERMRRFEEFEQRLVMSAAPLSDLGLAVAALNIDNAGVDVAAQFELATQLNDIHSETGVEAIHQDYGFDGTGQTVAVIDSGIAWDHFALGGAYGENARVVGGWDFAENDANPYDDGPAGFHGSHVAGIVGSGDAANLGVAPGVDLVGLRVFDDGGAGNLDWVEQALQWVHEHRDDFENPITTVNLSIGSDWNAHNAPEWATLEDEFALLEADGLFISVAAGNAFQSYNAAGLSYPAVSEHVVPVASHGADGDLSDFSQRVDGILAAPGESIRSSVPDHLLGGTQNSAYLGASGTSMAAPYVSGASTLLRQANEFMGRTGIDQDLLLQQFRETADYVFDSVTGGYFYRMNLEAAIQSVVTDQHGDNWSSAENVGQLGNGTQISGTIGSLNDIDVIEFTAAQTGQVTLEFDTTDDLIALVDVQNMNAQLNSNRVVFDVVAGQSYKFSIATSTGIGHYDIAVNYSAASFESENWGNVEAQSFNGQQVNGQQWYRMSAANEGILSIDAAMQNSGSMQLRVYDANMNEIAARAGAGGRCRVDVDAEAGETFLVKIVANGIADFNVNNLVSLTDGQLIIKGTSGNDSIDISAGSILLVDVNGMEYQFEAAEIDSIDVSGNGGYDLIRAELSADEDNVTIRTGRLNSSGSTMDITADGFEEIFVDAGGGNDRLTMHGSGGNDTFENNGAHVEFAGSGYLNAADGFERVVVVAGTGTDNARLNGNDGDDLFAFRDELGRLRNSDLTIVVSQFENILANGNGGDDLSNLFDTSADDQFTMRTSYSKLVTPDYAVRATGFERVNAFSESGNDSIAMYDSMGDDTFIGKPDSAVMFDGNYMNLATGFTSVTVNASGGDDLARLRGSNGSDTLHADSTSVRMTYASSTVVVNRFERVLADGLGGHDSAILKGTSGADVVYADVASTSVVSAVSSGQQINHAAGFESVFVDLFGGHDIANLQGSSGNESLYSDQQQVEFESTLQELRLQGMDDTLFDGEGGADEVIFSDFETLDLLSAVGDRATAVMNSHRVAAEDFALLEATAGNGELALHDIDVVDYLFNLNGNWQGVD